MPQKFTPGGEGALRCTFLLPRDRRRHTSLLWWIIKNPGISSAGRDHKDHPALHRHPKIPTLCILGSIVPMLLEPGTLQVWEHPMQQILHPLTSPSPVYYPRISRLHLFSQPHPFIPDPCPPPALYVPPFPWAPPFPPNLHFIHLDKESSQLQSSLKRLLHPSYINLLLQNSSFATGLEQGNQFSGSSLFLFHQLSLPNDPLSLALP